MYDLFIYVLAHKFLIRFFVGSAAPSELSTWGGIVATLTRVGFSGLHRRLKSFNASSLSQSPQLIAQCLVAMNDLCPCLQRDNVLTLVDGKPRPAFENRLVEKLFNWATHCIQEARARMSLAAIRSRKKVMHSPKA
jgi:hypothetical protein